MKTRTKNRLQVAIINTVVFIVVASAFIWIVFNYFHIGEKDFTNAAQVEEFINPINTRVSAYIKEIRFIEHQKVKKGDTLIILDNREILTQVAQAEAAYQTTLASRNVTESAIKTVSNNIKVTEANIAGAKARLANASKNMERYKNLIKTGTVSGFQYDQVNTEYEMALSAYTTLINQKNTAGLSVAEVKTRLELNEADIKRAKAALDMARINLSYTIITAPYDGSMGRRMINEGQLLQPGQQISTIVLDNQKWVTANFLEGQMKSIKIGSKVKMTADAVGDNEYEGVVTALSAATGSRYSNIPVDNSTGNFVKVQQRIPVRIEFTDNNKKEMLLLLKAGMNMNLTVEN